MFSKMITKNVLKEYSLTENMRFLKNLVLLGFKPATIERVEAYVVELLLQPDAEPTVKMLNLYLTSVQARRKIS
jgi:hypothetical protein